MDIWRVEAFFFAAMQSGYAMEGVPKAKVPDMPGYKETRYRDDAWLLVDRWCVNPDSDKSVGTTTIWYQNDPVWVMHYGGYYPQAYIPFLKMVLFRQYSWTCFNGGRGPAEFYDKQSGMIYTNRPERNKFTRFNGQEEILGISARGDIVTLVGWHEYWGMSLL